MKLFKKVIITATLLASTSWATENVAIVWPFNIGSAQANYARLMIESANSKQHDYVFYLDSKPGASGAIAVNHVINSNSLTLVSHSSSFFLRPNFFPKESYDIDNLKPVLVQAVNQPLAIISSKYSNLEELKKQTRLTIGMQNGGITQLVSEQLAKLLPNTELVLVPFNGSIDATQSMLSGNTDLSVDMLRDIRQWIDMDKVKVIGLTGTRNIGNLKSFKSQGLQGFDRIVQNYIIYANVKVSDDEVKRLHDILNEANKNTDLLKFYQEDFAEPVDLDIYKTKQFFQSLRKFWK